MKIFRLKLFALVSTVFVFTNVHAQSKSTHYPEWNVRTSLTSYFDYNAGIMLGVGCRWSDRFSAAFEPTWIFYNSFSSETEAKVYPSGIKIRTDVKLYLNKRRGKVDFFLAPEYHYKYVESQKQGNFGINCIGGSCAYFQDAYYTEIKKEHGGLLKIGLNCWFPFVNDPRLQLEFNTGFGAKTRTFRETNLPSGGSFIGGPNRNGVFIGTDRGVPLIPFGLKMLFILKKPVL